MYKNDSKVELNSVNANLAATFVADKYNICTETLMVLVSMSMLSKSVEVRFRTCGHEGVQVLNIAMFSKNMIECTRVIHNNITQSLITTSLLNMLYHR